MEPWLAAQLEELDLPVAMVTGASSGTGREIARALEARDHAIVANSGGMPQRHPSVAAIGTRRIVAVPRAVGDPEVARRVFNAALSNFDGMVLLANDAGIFISRPFNKYSVQALQVMMNTNMRRFKSSRYPLS